MWCAFVSFYVLDNFSGMILSAFFLLLYSGESATVLLSASAANIDSEILFYLVEVFS